MDEQIKNQMINMAHAHLHTGNADPAHDFSHALRVMKNAEQIAGRDKGDLDILIPASLFHDAVTYPKNDHRSSCAQEKSASVISTLLFCMGDFPQRKISDVVLAITSCSFTKNVKPDTLEGKILRDDDGLEATGVIAIMRTFTPAAAWAGHCITQKTRSVCSGSQMTCNTVLISFIRDY